MWFLFFPVDLPEKYCFMILQNDSPSWYPFKHFQNLRTNFIQSFISAKWIFSEYKIGQKKIKKKRSNDFWSARTLLPLNLNFFWFFVIKIIIIISPLYLNSNRSFLQDLFIYEKICSNNFNNLNKNSILHN